MSEYRTKILTMLSEGKISVAEAEKLLNVVGSKESSSKKEFAGTTTSQFFNILVDSEKEDGTRVKIKIPLRLIKAGMKFANLIPEESREKIQKTMRSKGINFDLNEIDALNVDELLEALQALEVNVVDGESSETVRIFCA